jgi:hypothetical protein
MDGRMGHRLLRRRDCNQEFADDQENRPSMKSLGKGTALTTTFFAALPSPF